MAGTAGCGGPGSGGGPTSPGAPPDSGAQAPATASGPTTPQTSVRADGGLPQLPNQTFYVSDQTSAARQLATLRGQGRTAEAADLLRIAAQPSSQWLGEQDARSIVEQVSRRAADADRTPVFVAYDIPHRDCGQYSAGGAADAASYRTWISGVAQALGDRKAWVIVEPDAVAHTLDACGVKGDLAAERYGLLAFAVQELKKRPRVRVYLDAGNPGWSQDPSAMADALRKSGIAVADGFAVNVANFYGTDADAAYGGRLSAALGGKHFVIDTSRNGNGPLGGDSWCNPPGRALGEPPTTDTGRPGVDAYLWIKNPGESDGECGRGEPRAGEFWLPYALGLAKAAR
ncbi:glycoside hydrolase family 6 protein [Streptomyces sp. SP17BM10]|uniref:glycoside hydrolase family 6 protein n=1 Tax=Streptomyces sp. SP17BM10 TaxID=3002530 RepID=UPI002E7971FE|nr:glycoside hydrolase family 6 protein [Streptomyces sp. SP17BM10]MEE1785890.1 glycoside hydrolase family 6 protein [Streptomyces sp. SP17BM10]